MAMLWSSTARAGSIPAVLSTPYQYTSGNCNSDQCAITFPAVSAQTLISQVTCYITAPNSSGPSLASLENENQTVFNILPVITYNTYSDTTNYVIDAPDSAVLKFRPRGADLCGQ